MSILPRLALLGALALHWPSAWAEEAPASAAVAVTVVYGFIISYVILTIIDKTMGLRVTEEQEREGLDISLHGESLE